MGPSPTYHPPEGEEFETSVEHGLPLWAEPVVGYCSRRPRPSPMWGSRFVGARAVGPWVGEQKPLGKSPLRGNPSPESTYLPTWTNIILGRGYSDAVVVLDDTPAMAAKIAMSDLRTKVAFLAVSTIKQKDLGNAVGGAQQHAIIMRYMLEADQTEQGATAATWDTQEQWLQRGIPLWVSDSNRGHEGHQQVHAAEAVQEDVVTEAPADDTVPVAPTPTLPMQAKVNKTAKVIPTEGTAAGKGTPSSSNKQAKGKEKESDKPAESDDHDADEEEEEEDTEQVLET